MLSFIPPEGTSNITKKKFLQDVRTKQGIKKIVPDIFLFSSATSFGIGFRLLINDFQFSIFNHTFQSPHSFLYSFPLILSTYSNKSNLIQQIRLTRPEIHFISNYNWPRFYFRVCIYSIIIRMPGMKTRRFDWYNP